MNRITVKTEKIKFSLVPLAQLGMALVFLYLFTSCAYRMGAPERTLPGGHKKLAIKMFSNATMEPGIEVYFTNSLIQEFERSKLSEITPVSLAEVALEGHIESITQLAENLNSSVPDGSYLAANYRLLLVCHVRLVRLHDEKTLWSSQFTGEKTYNAAVVGQPIVNSVNPIYNLSAKRQTIEAIAKNLMSQAFDRITENF